MTYMEQLNIFKIMSNRGRVESSPGQGGAVWGALQTPGSWESSQILVL